ncbi:hypothetical protein [Ensifer canadensis]
MGETTDHSGEFVLPKRVWLLFVLTLLVGPLIGWSCGYILGVAVGYVGFSISLFLSGWIVAYAFGLVPAVMSVLLIWCVVMSSQRWSVRLSLALLSGFFATALYATLLGSTFQDGADAIFVGGAIGALAQVTCIVLWRRLGGG